MRRALTATVADVATDYLKPSLPLHAASAAVERQMLSLAAESCYAGASLMQLKLKAASDDDAER